jgi:type IV secretory pathway VirD2 relaxase
MAKGEEREFRLRPRKPPIPRKRNESAACALAFKAIAHYARTSRRRKATRNSGRGGAKRAPIPRNQRCAVRVTYSRNTIRGQWRAHGRYIARESAATDPATAGFDAEKHGIEIAGRLDSWQSAGDRRLWKMIISPEFGERVDLVRLTRELMTQVESDLEIPLEWVAVAHFNTEHPHVHVALRGVGRDQREVRLPREYVKSGIRGAAEDLCTRQLGHRTDLDAAEAERREIREKRFTSLDRIILRTTEMIPGAPSWDVTIPPGGRKSGENDFAWTRRQHLISRLEVLEDMGLARSEALGVWNLRSDFAGVLRAMQRAGDRQKVLAAHGVLLSDERLPMEALDVRQMTSEGRVLVHGEDEQSGRRYLMLEGVDARVHYIEYTREMEDARSRGELRTNSFVRLRRILADDESRIEIEDLGDSEALLKNRRYFQNQARELLKRGVVPNEDGWGGWLGQYQAGLKQAATELEDLSQARGGNRTRDRSRGL